MLRRTPSREGIDAFPLPEPISWQAARGVKDRDTPAPTPAHAPMDLTDDALRSDRPGRESGPGATQDPEAFLRDLLGDLAHRSAEARFRVAPNPCVGAAVLSRGVEVGRGYHEVWGGNHAEVAALEAAAASGMPRDTWDTMVVTLEPCSSEGKTPPCVEAILAAGIGRVVVAELDPDPRHRGRGIELLQRAGVEVLHLGDAAPLSSQSPYFLRWTSPERLRRRRPWMIAKWAQTRTGQLLPPEDVGEGRWITSPEARAHVQHLRASVEAIVTGVGTVRADDPRLTVRAPARARRPPLRVVLDTELRTPPEARLFAAEDAGESKERGGAVHLFARPGGDGARRRALEARGATIHSVSPGDDGRLSLRDVSSTLWELGVRRAMLEAGPTLTAAWMEAELVDQLRVYTGEVNGGRGPSLANRLLPERLESVAHDEIGPDAVLEGFLGP